MFDYITADTHFGHIHINVYEPTRMGKAQTEGYDYFDEYMIEEWNEIVKEDDKILHLGDFAFKDGYLQAKKLKGNITLLIGNHDKPAHLDYYRSLGWRVIDSIEVQLENMSEKEHHEFKSILNQISNKKEHKLTAALITEYDSKRILFSHFPVFDDNPYDEKYKATTSVLEELYILFNCEINIHGHTHSAGAKEKFCKSACLELNNFKLIKEMDFLL
jgi:calcineurin-like phosphoesterase family protein